MSSLSLSLWCYCSQAWTASSFGLFLSLCIFLPILMFFTALRQTQFFISLPTLNQALLSYQFETLKLHAFSLPTSHQTAPDHTLEHFFTRMLDTMNSSSIKMVTCKYPPKKEKKPKNSCL